MPAWSRWRGRRGWIGHRCCWGRFCGTIFWIFWIFQVSNFHEIFKVLGFGCLFAFVLAILEFLWNVKNVAIEEKVCPNYFLRTQQISNSILGHPNGGPKIRAEIRPQPLDHNKTGPQKPERGKLPIPTARRLRNTQHKRKPEFREGGQWKWQNWREIQKFAEFE